MYKVVTELYYKDGRTEHFEDKEIATFEEAHKLADGIIDDDRFVSEKMDLHPTEMEWGEDGGRYEDDECAEITYVEKYGGFKRAERKLIWDRSKITLPSGTGKSYSELRTVVEKQ